jgi:lambda family phage tail tape measure protein
MATVLDILVNVKGDASKNLKGIQASIGQTTKSFALLKTAIAAATTGLAVQFVRNTLAAADAIGKVADKTGFAIDSLQELRFAAEQAGIANVQLDTSLQRFSRRVGEAAQGTGVLYEILQQSGIAIRNADGSMRSIEATFNDYLGVMASATSEQEKLRLAVAAFDMEGAAMVNMLKDGTAGLEAMRARARGLGIILDEETVRSAERANDAWGQVANQFRAITTIAIGQLAPALENVANRMAVFLADPEKVKELEEAFATIGATIIGIADAVAYLREGFINAILSAAGFAFALGKTVDIIKKGVKFYRGMVDASGAARVAAAQFGLSVGGLTVKAQLLHKVLYGLELFIAGALVTVLLNLKDVAIEVGKAFYDAGYASDEFRKKLEAFEKSDLSFFDLLKSYFTGEQFNLQAGTGKTFDEYIAGIKRTQEAAKKLKAEQEKQVGEQLAAQLSKEQLALEKLNRTYASTIRQTEEQIRSQTRAIGKGQDYLDLQNLLNQAASAHNATLVQLGATLDEASRKRQELGLDTESAQYKALTQTINQTREAINRLNAEYDQHKKVLVDLAAAQAKANAAFQFEQFQTKARIDLENQLLDIQDEMAKATLPAIEQRYYDIAAAARDSAKAAIEAEEARRGGPLNKAEVEQYYAAARRGQDQLIRATKQHYDMTRSWSYGWKQAFQEYYENATNAAQKARDIFSQTMQGIEDILVNFVKTGKFEWKQFAADILESMLRMNIQSTLGNLGQMIGLGDLFGSATQQRGNSPTQPLYVLDVSTGRVAQTSSAIGNVFNNAGSGSNFLTSAWNTVKNIGSSIGNVVSSVASGIGNLFSGFFATGGTIPPGRYGIVGERGPEYVSGPATVTPMGNTQVTYNINAVDAASFKALVARDPGFIHAVAMQGARSIPMGR